jgi:peptidyl-prolyl cis-trans isomerase B (cyclophilin B)
MAVCAKRWRRTVVQPALVGLWLGAFVVGCGGQAPAPGKQEQGKNPPPAAITAPNPSLASVSAAAAASAGQTGESSFKQAVFEEPPDENQSLPEKTKTGKSVGKLYEQISARGGLWDQVKFTTPDGKKLGYTATIKTDLGLIKIELWPEVAPNHVRNFIALARAGYYEGLEFDHTVREEFEEEKGKFFECLDAGCPLCKGDPNYGSIGYWLKPELSDKVKHEAGTVGAWHGEELETAACKFYITLSKAPWMDGGWTIFGKVVQGFEVARTILQRPVRNDEFRDRPEQPVVIRSVTIETHPASAAGTR